VTIPNSVNAICKDAFKDCTSLESVVLPHHVSVHSTSFINCESLSAVTITVPASEALKKALSSVSINMAVPVSTPIDEVLSSESVAITIVADKQPNEVLSLSVTIAVRFSEDIKTLLSRIGQPITLFVWFT